MIFTIILSKFKEYIIYFNYIYIFFDLMFSL